MHFNACFLLLLFFPCLKITVKKKNNHINTMLFPLKKYPPINTTNFSATFYLFLIKLPKGKKQQIHSFNKQTDLSFLKS